MIVFFYGDLILNVKYYVNLIIQVFIYVNYGKCTKFEGPYRLLGWV